MRERDKGKEKELLARKKARGYCIQVVAGGRLLSGIEVPRRPSLNATNTFSDWEGALYGFDLVLGEVGENVTEFTGTDMNLDDIRIQHRSFLSVVSAAANQISRLGKEERDSRDGVYAAITNAANDINIGTHRQAAIDLAENDSDFEGLQHKKSDIFREEFDRVRHDQHRLRQLKTASGLLKDRLNSNVSQNERVAAQRWMQQTDIQIQLLENEGIVMNFSDYETSQVLETELTRIENLLGTLSNLEKAFAGKQMPQKFADFGKEEPVGLKEKLVTLKKGSRQLADYATKLAMNISELNKKLAALLLVQTSHLPTDDFEVTIAETMQTIVVNGIPAYGSGGEVTGLTPLSIEDSRYRIIPAEPRMVFNEKTGNYYTDRNGDLLLIPDTRLGVKGYDGQLRPVQFMHPQRLANTDARRLFKDKI